MHIMNFFYKDNTLMLFADEMTEDIVKNLD